MIAPVFHELSNEYGSRVQFIKVDVDENPEAAQKYGVSAMPTFLFIKGGEEVDRLMGANSERLKEVCRCGCVIVLLLHHYHVINSRLIVFVGHFMLAHQ